ncbi:hypothetical protein SEVIR_2G400666v4 [Setaria viridis]
MGAADAPPPLRARGPSVPPRPRPRLRLSATSSTPPVSAVGARGMSPPLRSYLQARACIHRGFALPITILTARRVEEVEKPGLPGCCLAWPREHERTLVWDRLVVT